MLNSQPPFPNNMKEGSPGDQNGPQEMRFEIKGKHIAARVWGPESGLKVIAVHGWLDNASSFDELAPRLADCRVVAIDTAGHGQSDHRSPDANYNIWDDIPDIVGIADRLGWDEFSLLGHSRGAIISMLICGSFPQRIKSAVMLDGFWPEAAKPEDSPAQLAKAISEAQSKRAREVYFDSIEPFVEARTKGIFELSEKAARLIAERNLRRSVKGYTWSFDSRLKNASMFKLTRAHIDAFAKSIQSPIKVILAEQGIAAQFSGLMGAIKQLDVVTLDILPGGHHFHLEEETVSAVADSVNQFFAQISSS